MHWNCIALNKQTVCCIKVYNCNINKFLFKLYIFVTYKRA